jgi:recombination protein RecR
MKSFSAEKLIKIFSKFPTVGPRTAARFVFYLIQKPKEETDELINAILELKKNVKICTLCFNHFESDNGEALCEICSDQRRDKTLLCLVEKEIDLISFEKIKRYKGLYFVLGGSVSAIKKSDMEKLRTKELEQRIKGYPEIKEIIVAFNPTTEGEATSLYIERLLKPLNKKFTHLGRGLPTGAELEYADEETLGAAFEGRK